MNNLVSFRICFSISPGNGFRDVFRLRSVSSRNDIVDLSCHSERSEESI
jgi:hypothetical protein